MRLSSTAIASTMASGTIDQFFKRVIELLALLLLASSEALAAYTPPNEFCYSSQCYPSLEAAEVAMKAASVYGNLLERNGSEVTSATGDITFKYRVPDQPAKTFYGPTYKAPKLQGTDNCARTDPYEQSGCADEQAAAAQWASGVTASGCTVSGSPRIVGSYDDPPSYVSTQTVGGFAFIHSYGSGMGPAGGRGREVEVDLNCPGLSNAKYSASMDKHLHFDCPTGFRPVNSNITVPSTAAIPGAKLCVANGATPIITGKVKQCASCPANDNPIHPATGDKSRAEIDLTFAGRPFTRYYHSRRQFATPGLPQGWTHTYSHSVVDNLAFWGLLYAVSSDGNFEVLKDLGNGKYRPENSHDQLFERLSGAIAFRLTYGNGEVHEFNASGRLIAMRNPSAPESDVTLEYSGSLLAKVVDKRGRALTFEYTDGFLSRLVLPDGKSVGYQYDSDLNLIAAAYGENQVKQYHYHEPGLAAALFENHLTGITSEDGARYASFGYDEFGRATSSRLHAGAGYVVTTTLDYNSANVVTANTAEQGAKTYTMQDGVYRRILSVAGGGAAAHSKTYQTDGRTKTYTDARGITTSYDYQPSYQSAVTEAFGTAQERKTTTARDSAQRVTRRESWGLHNGAQTIERVDSYSYDGSGRLLHSCTADAASTGALAYVCGSATVPPAGVRQTHTTYCEQADITAGTCPLLGLVTAVNGPRTDLSDITTYTYYPSDDATCASAPTTCPHRKGDLWLVQDALGNITETLKYDGAGRVLAVKDANGIVTDFEYHSRGWLTARKVRGADDAVETDDQITRIEYWPTGLVKQVTQPDGTFLSFTYDPAQRLTRITDRAGFYIEYTLDDAGNRVLEETRNPAGSTLYRTLSRVYNALGQLQTQADAASNPTDFTYDANGNADTVTDALDRVTDHDYDPLNRLQRTLQDVGGIEAETALEYDALNNLIKVTDPKGLDTTYAYNGFGDLTQQTSPDTGVTAYTYDSAGNRKTQTDARGVTSTYSYDALNRLTTIGYSTDSTYDIAYTWDTTQPSCVTNETFGEGRLTRVQNGHGAIIEYCYGRFGQLVRKKQTINGKAFTVRYAYTKTGALASVTYPDGMVVEYTRNTTGRINTVGVTPSGGARQVLISAVSNYPFGPQLNLTYGNGRVLNRTHDQDYKPTAMRDDRAGGLQTGYGYDPAGQLDELHLPANPAVQLARYRYDGLGRLDQVQDGPTGTPIETYGYDATGNRTSLTDSVGTQAYAYPADSHRLSSVAGIDRTYDDTGNTTSIGGPAREFFYTPGGRMRLVKNNGAEAMNYSYNGLGEQVRRYATTSDPDQRYSVYDESGQWLGEYDLNGVPTQQIVWLDDLPVGLVDAAGLKYVEPDHLGTPRAVIDPVRDVAVWKWEATGEAFGNDPPDQNPDGDAYPLVFDMRFPGQRYDSATGLNYNYFRDYDPLVGRYAQSDPVGLIGGLTTFGYVGGMPLQYEDHYGLFWGVAAAAACEFFSGAGGHWRLRRERHFKEVSMQRRQSYEASCNQIYLACANSPDPSCVPDALAECARGRKRNECDLYQLETELRLRDEWPWWDLLGQLCNMGTVKTSPPKDPL